MGLAIVGLIWVGGTIGKGVAGLFKSDEYKYLDYVYPTVITDVPEFASDGTIPDTNLLTAGIWDIILYADTTKYEHTFDNVYVPQGDIEKSVAKLFGEFKTTHQTVTFGSYTVYYDEKNKRYTMPLKPFYFSYRPQIEECTEKGDTVVLTLKYYNDTPDWFNKSKNYKNSDETSVVKYMKFTIENGVITSVENVSEEFGLKGGNY
jgi:hypothetical protein